MSTEYLAEVTYGNIENFENFKNSIQKGLFEIQKEHHYFDINRDVNGVTISHDFLTATIKLKPLPNDMPDEIKEKIIALFKEHAKVNQ